MSKPANAAGGSKGRTGDRSSNLEGLLDQLADAGRDHGEVSVRDLRDAIGRRSFGPLLLAVSIVGFTPLGGIPGVPTTLAVFIVLIAGQIVLGLKSVWLPGFLLNRSIDGGKLTKAAGTLKRVAHAVDKVIRPRLTFLTDRPYSQVIAVVCILIALTVPPLEFLPFVDIPLWIAIVAFSLALVAHDGLLAIAAFILTAAGATLIATALL